MTSCPQCSAEVQPGWKACPMCGEPLPEMPSCHSCGAELQQGWKACPTCGNKVDSGQGASLNITDAVVKEIHQSQTVDRSVQVGGDVSGTLITGETVNSVVNQIDTINISSLSQQQFGVITQQLNQLLEQAGISTEISAEPIESKPSPETNEIVAAVERKVEEAGQRFEAAVGDPEMHLRLGNAAYESGEYERAIQDLDEAIRLDPQYAFAYNNRGIAYRLLGQYNRAIQDYDEAIRLDPQYADAYYNRGVAYYNLGQYERAIQDWDEAIRLDPQYALAYNNRGIAYANLGQYEREIEDYDEAIRLDPQFALAYYNRGIAYGDLGQQKLADDDFAKAKELGNDP